MDHAEKLIRMEAHMKRLGIPKLVHSPPAFAWLRKAGVPMVPPLFMPFWKMVGGLLAAFAIAAAILWFVEPVAAIAAVLVGLPLAFLVPAFYRFIARRKGLPPWSEYEGDGSQLPAPGIAGTRTAKPNESSLRELFTITIFGKELPYYWTLILFGALVVMLDVGLRLDIKALTFSFLDEFAAVGQGEFRNAGYSPGGTIHVDEIELTPTDGGEPTRVARVIVETPGSLWLLRKSLPSFSPRAPGQLGRIQRLEEINDRLEGEVEISNEYPPTERLAIRFEDIDWGRGGLPWVLPEIDWVGSYSGSLFEAAGCEHGFWWKRDSVRTRFGAPRAEAAIAIDFEVTGPHTLGQRIVVGRGGNSSVKIERDFELPGEAERFLDIDSDAWRTTRVRWTVEDKGFVRARNAWCANLAKIDEPKFIERHLAAVRRTLLATGFVPDEELMQGYRAFAENGGTLVWETRLPHGIALEDLDARGPSGALSAMNARIMVNGAQPVAYQGRLVEPEDWPKGEGIDSVVAVLRHEGRLGNVEQPDEVQSVIAASSPEPAPAAPTPPIDLYFPQAQAETTPADGTPTAIHPRDLARHVGKPLRLKLSNGRRYTGHVESVAGNTISFKVLRRGGNASLTFSRSQIAAVESGGY